jgi:uncharacterized membrane protein
MHSLIVALFDSPDKAASAHQELLDAQLETRIAPEEIAVLVVEPNGDVAVNDTAHPTIPTALSGGFVGVLVGLMLFNPALALIGGIAGIGAGATMGALKDVGIDETFMNDLAAKLKPGSSALFIRVRQEEGQPIVDMLAPLSQKVLQAVLAHGDKSKLTTALSETQPVS